MLRDLKNILTEVAWGGPEAVAVIVETFWIAARTALPMLSANADSLDILNDSNVNSYRTWSGAGGGCRLSLAFKHANMTESDDEHDEWGHNIQSKWDPSWLAIMATGHHKSRTFH